jgi:hypothetical protein
MPVIRCQQKAETAIEAVIRRLHDTLPELDLAAGDCGASLWNGGERSGG